MFFVSYSVGGRGGPTPRTRSHHIIMRNSRSKRLTVGEVSFGGKSCRGFPVVVPPFALNDRLLPTLRVTARKPSLPLSAMAVVPLSPRFAGEAREKLPVAGSRPAPRICFPPRQIFAWRCDCGVGILRQQQSYTHYETWIRHSYPP